MTSDPRQTKERLRLFWFLPAGVALIVVVIGLRVSLPIYRQAVAIQKIERLGGRVTYTPAGPGWVRQILPASWLRGLDEVNQIYVENGNFNDEALIHLSDLRRLKQLAIRNTMVRGTGFRYLTELQGLEALVADNSGINDEGLAELARLKGLKKITLGNTPITDAGVDHLTALPQLEALNLEGTEAGNKSLASISRLRNLTWLQLDRTRVTDEGCGNLLGLSKLETLQVNALRVSDEKRAKLRQALPGANVYPE